MHWNAGDYEKHADFVSRLGEEVLLLLQPQAGESILDIGCGDGALTKQIVQAGACVRGIDSSAEMVAAARGRGICATVMDAHGMAFADEFDGVFSNAALHWMKEFPDEVIRRVFRALRRGGRFCAEFGVVGNIAAIRAALARVLAAMGLEYENYEPWYFPAADEYGKKLEAAGFTVSYLETFNRPTELPTNLYGWLNVFAQPFLRDIALQERQRFLHAIVEELESTLKKDGDVWIADYVRCRFLAVKT